LPGTLDGPAAAQQLRVRQPWLKASSERLRCPVRDCGDVVPWPFKRRELLGCVFEMLQRADLAGLAAARSGGPVYRPAEPS
jgi:hypothetical protein